MNSLLFDQGQGKSLSNMISSDQLKRLLDAFSISTGLRVSLTDAEGNCLLSSQLEDNDFCRLIRGSSRGPECCKTYQRAGEEAYKWNEPYIFQCHAGLVVWVCPVLYNDSHVANLVCGQVLMWKPEDYSLLELKTLTKILDIDHSLLSDSLQGINVVSSPQVQAAADLLYVLASYLGKIGMELFDYQKRLRSVGSWLWTENNRKKQENNFLPASHEGDQQLFKLESQIFCEIRKGNSEKAKKLLDTLALQFFLRSKGQIEIIKGLSVEFISFLSRTSTECGVEFEKSIQFGISRLKDLETANTVEKVMLWLLTTGNSYIEMLGEHNCTDSQTTITKAIAYVQNNYASQNLSLKAVAKGIYISSSYLSRQFKQEKGCSMTEYINRVRIERAKELLLETQKTNDDIANNVGYKDRSYFCKVFKQIVGVTPNEYRKKSFQQYI